MMSSHRLACGPVVALLVASCGESPPAEPTTPDDGAASAARKQGASIDDIGREVSGRPHLEPGEEFALPLPVLLEQGEQFFTAVFTPQEGGGRPLTKGTGDPLVDPDMPLVFPDNFNRISAMDSNACSSCHSLPFTGGGGHFSANAFIPGQRFDFITFDHDDPVPTRGARDEEGKFPTLQQITNSRASLGMNGSGFIEMLARQMTSDLQRQRDGLARGESVALRSKGVSFGTLSRRADGTFDISQVEGLPAQALFTTPIQGGRPPLVLQPFHQAGTVVSIRQFTNNALNHHHGIQSVERFGAGEDPDGDGFVDEASIADVTALTIFQATLGVPGRVIPNDPVLEEAILMGEELFDQIGCTSCHMSSLPLDDEGWIFVEPNPFNPSNPPNLQPGEVPDFSVDLTNHDDLPGPRLEVVDGVVHVPAFTDLKLHDITTGPDDPNRDPIDMNAPPGSDQFFDGTGRFLTKKLWGAANEPPFFHHGKFTTLREAILAHAGEAADVTAEFEALGTLEQGSIIEFLKSLQVLPERISHRVVDENGHEKIWPPK